ncbi:hypothetical protein HDV06_004185 [Boothiomyces sp. JEL0866]|nr:hypothetical protein HDV06_004185 [Boothiomyces sp. JEL0866]
MHLVSTSIKDATNFEELLEYLDSESKRKVTRMYKRNDKILQLTGIMLTRTNLYNHLKTKKFEIQRTDKGRPFIPNSPFDFNLSHHGDYVAFICDTERVGVDVAKIDMPVDIFDHFDEVFSKTEWNFIRAPQTEFEKQKRFACLWGLKEAYVKHIGCGITVDLNVISFHLNQGGNDVQLPEKYGVRLYVKGVLQDYKFRVFMLDDNHVISVCAKNEITELKMVEWNHLVNDFKAIYR